MADSCIPSSRYVVTSHRYGLDPTSDGDGACISSDDVSSLAVEDYGLAINFLRKVSIEDRASLLGNMRQKFFEGHASSIDQDVDARIRSAFQAAGDSNFFTIVDPRNQSINQSDTLTDSSGKIEIKKEISPLLRPKHLPQQVMDFFSGDPELGLSHELYTGANCISYAFKSVLPKLQLEDSDGNEITGLVWTDAFIDPNNAQAIDEILKQSKATLVQSYNRSTGEEKEAFVYQTEQNILSDSKIKEGDILLISYIDADGQKKYSHAAILQKGKEKRLILTGKFGPYAPVIKTSISEQINHYMGMSGNVTVAVYHLP